MVFQLADLEGQTHDFVVLGHGALGELGAQVAGELTVVELADDDFLVFAQDVASVLGERADVVEVGVGHFLAFVVHLLDGEGEGAAGAAPANDEQVGVGVAGDLLVGDVVGHAVDLLLTVAGHEGVVLGVGAEGTVGALLKAADTVAEAFHAGQGPFACKFLFVAAEGTEVGVVLLGETGFDFGHVLHAGDLEELAAIAEVTVGEQDDGGHVLEGNLGGVEGPVEAVGAGGSGDDHEGGFTVAAVECLVEVALLGLGGQTRGGTAALDVDDDEGKLGHDGETQGFALERETGAGGAGAGQGTGIAGADG